MKYAIKDWSEFQHYKDRDPKWIKLYSRLLNNPEWHSLSGNAGKRLVMLWLLASESPKRDGELPNLKTMAFRLRISETEMRHTLEELSDFLVSFDTESTELPQIDSLEKSRDREETETETETDGVIPFSEILADLNQKAGTKCRLSPPTRKAIQARWAEGFRLADFQHVHTVKCQDWLHDPGMRKHLHPDTLYRPSKFEKYVNQEERKKEQEWTPPDE